MSFFDDFMKTASTVASKAAKGVESAAKTAVHKSSDFAEVSKLKMKITAEEKSIEDIYYEIGKKVYQDCADSGVVPEGVQGECSAIYEHKARIAELNGRIELIRGGNDFTSGEEDVAFTVEEEVIVEDVEETDLNRETNYADISESIKNKEQ